MADYYEIEIRPKRDDGCGSIVAFIIFVVILGLFLSMCDNGSSSNSSSSHSNISAQPTPSQSMDLGYIWLTDLSPISSESLYGDRYYDTISNIGTELTHCLRTGTKYHGGPGEGWIEYYIDGGYKYLSGYLAITQDFNNTEYTGNLIIYADGKEIFRTDEMAAGDAPIYFQLSVSGAERIRIEHKGGEPFRVANLKLWTNTPSKN